MYGAYERTLSVFQNSDMMATGPARRRRSSSCSSRSAARCRTRCSANLSCRRCRTAPARTARCCARPRNCCRTPAAPIKDGKRVLPNGETDHHRVPDRRADVRAAPHAVHQESRHPRHRGDPAHRRPGAIPRPRATTSISTSPIDRFSFSATPGDSLRSFFSSQAAATKGSHNLAGIADPAIDALIDKIIAADTRAGSGDRLPRARSRDPRRPLLGSALVQGLALDRLLGCVRPSAGTAALFPRHSGNLVV